MFPNEEFLDELAVIVEIEDLCDLDGIFQIGVVDGKKGAQIELLALDIGDVGINGHVEDLPPELILRGIGHLEGFGAEIPCRLPVQWRRFLSGTGDYGENSTMIAMVLMSRPILFMIPSSLPYLDDI